MQGREEETGRDKGREAQRGEIDKGDRDRGRDRSRERAPENNKESTEGAGRKRPHSDTLRVGRDNDSAAGMDAAVSSTSGDWVPPKAPPRPTSISEATAESLRPKNLGWGQSLLGLCPESQSGTSWNQI